MSVSNLGEQDAGGRHESVDHDRPTDAGLMDPTGGEVPGTGIMGDETLVRAAPGVERPGTAAGPPAGTGGSAKPGPTPAE